MQKLVAFQVLLKSKSVTMEQRVTFNSTVLYQRCSRYFSNNPSFCCIEIFEQIAPMLNIPLLLFLVTCTSALEIVIFLIEMFLVPK